MCMKIYKKAILRYLFVFEILIFIGVYFFGNNGYKRIGEINDENKKLCLEIEDLKGEISVVQKEIQEWQASDFYKEKFARERLQMAKEGDEIYFIK